MKTFKIFSVLLALAVSVILGGIISSVTGISIPVEGFNIAPMGISALLFAGAFIPTPVGSLLGAYVKVNVGKPGQNAGRGGDLKDEIIFFDTDDVETWPTRDDAGVLMTGNFAFKAGAFMITVYSTPGSIENTSKSQGDPDAKGFIQGCKFLHPGNAQAIREFRTNWLNRNVGIIHRKCSDATKMDVYGTACSPLQLQVVWTENKDKNFNEFTFESLSAGPDIGIYSGDLDFDESSDS